MQNRAYSDIPQNDIDSVSFSWVFHCGTVSDMNKSLRLYFTVCPCNVLRNWKVLDYESMQCTRHHALNVLVGINRWSIIHFSNIRGHPLRGACTGYLIHILTFDSFFSKQLQTAPNQILRRIYASSIWSLAANHSSRGRGSASTHSRAQMYTCSDTTFTLI